MYCSAIVMRPVKGWTLFEAYSSVQSDQQRWGASVGDERSRNQRPGSSGDDAFWCTFHTVLHSQLAWCWGARYWDSIKHYLEPLYFADVLFFVFTKFLMFEFAERPPPCPTSFEKFYEDLISSFYTKLLQETNRQTDRQTDKRRVSHNLLGASHRLRLYFTATAWR